MQAVTLAEADGVTVERVIVVEHLKRITVPGGASRPQVRFKHKFRENESLQSPACSHARDETWSSVVEGVKGMVEIM